MVRAARGAREVEGKVVAQEPDRIAICKTVGTRVLWQSLGIALALTGAALLALGLLAD